MEKATTTKKIRSGNEDDIRASLGAIAVDICFVRRRTRWEPRQGPHLLKNWMQGL